MSADHNDQLAIEKRLKTASRKLAELAPMVGLSKQVRAYDSDRRKNLLAKYMIAPLKAGESAASAEAHARGDAAYQNELELLADQLQTAEKFIAQNEAEHASWESCRSLLAMQRETIRNLPE